MSKRCLIIRLGAIGDCIIISPVIKRLKELGYYIILNTNQRGMDVYKHDKRVDEFIGHDEKMPIEKLPDYWDKLKKEVAHDKFVNFSESIECNVVLHPQDPLYIYPKHDRYQRCNRNYYDVTEEWAGLDNCDKRPSLVFTEEEDKEAKAVLKEKHFNIVWALSGSGKNKVWPWTDYVMGDILKDKDVHILTIGDEKCQILEFGSASNRVTNLSGKVGIRTSLCLTKHADLVISPDTGVLHASGCFSTPKIGLLGHTTKENITKYFINDYSIEAQCACAPCFRLIYEYAIQCPLCPVTKSAWCMAVGIQPENVFFKYKEVRNANKMS
jgi:ADP-heptose:LPS heptosyltransferase